MNSTQAANNNAPTVTTFAVVGFGRSGKRVLAGSKSARTFAIELTWDTGTVTTGPATWTSLFAAAGHAARMYNAASAVGLV
jgi:hypothetical protein